MPKISIIIPCYYNEGNLPVTTARLIENEANFPAGVELEYVLVDDGSKDNTYAEMQKFQKAYPARVKIIKLSRNYGAGNASMSGILHSSGDCMAILAADLQDPPELIPELYKHWLRGYKLVLAFKANREDSFITRLFSNTYHNMVRKLALPNAPVGGFDMWLFDKQLKDELLKMDERNFYLPSLFIWMGFEYVSIPYTRRKREIGKSKWTISKKIKSFVDSFVSFTYLPLRFISVTGFLLGIIAVIYAVLIFINNRLHHIPVEGWTSLMIVLLLVSSFIMISIGIIGEYLWRTLDASRKRPNYIIDKITDETGR
jgi:glycosyltransferase involved in cell wall biosynthesis